MGRELGWRSPPATGGEGQHTSGVWVLTRLPTCCDCLTCCRVPLTCRRCCSQGTGSPHTTSCQCHNGAGPCPAPHPPLCVCTGYVHGAASLWRLGCGVVSCCQPPPASQPGSSCCSPGGVTCWSCRCLRACRPCTQVGGWEAAGHDRGLLTVSGGVDCMSPGMDNTLLLSGQSHPASWCM